MISLKAIKNQKYNNIKLVEVLFYTFPLSFIAGNLILSVHLLLFLISSLFIIKAKKLNFNFKKTYWLLIAFFSYFFLSTAIQYQIPGVLNDAIFDQQPSWGNHPTFKSFLLIRFLILIVVIDVLFFNRLIKLKNFFFISLICTSFVSIDIIIQYVFGQDIFGLKPSGYRNSGPFGDELIAGGYLEKFSFISFFYISEFTKNKKFNLFLIFIITIHSVGILLAGNKMPMLLFFFGTFLIILFVKRLRVNMLAGILIFITTTFFILKNDPAMNSAYSGFFDQINFMKNIEIEKNEEKKDEAKKEIENQNLNKNKIFNYLKYSGHNIIYETAIIMWKEQPLFGFGQKSFRIKCHEISSPDTLYMRTMMLPKGCSTHPHNYYLEILSEGGIIGAVLLIIFFIIVLKDSISCHIKNNYTTILEKYLSIPLILVFFLEIWPLKSTGSFFTTWNASFFWLIAAILLAINTKKKLF